MSETSGPTVAYVIAQAETPAGQPHGIGSNDPHAGQTGVEIATPAGEAEGSHFPPFDAHTFPSQLLWLAIAFVLLYVLMSKVALPRIGSIIEDRQTRIDNDLAEAQKSKEETEAAIASYEASLTSARAKAQTIATETRDKVNAEADAQRKTIESQLTDRLTAAEKQIADTKAQALSNVRTIAVDAASAIVARLSGAEPSAKDVESAVDASLKG
jgi:F-type H+-transporting ATPase subunit b